MNKTVISDSDAVARQQLDQHFDKELLRFITCGSVDDGKSTLIGRLLLEAGAVYDDQLAALQRDSAKHGTTGQEIDAALLLDGLEDERQQGITIDVAYRYFTTARRKFIIADTPGHEQYTRNMATGASTANLALILIDASKGLLTQTRRHAFIVSLLGIKHVIVAVNKMDLVDFDPAVFHRICADFRKFSAKLDIPEIRFVPLSALHGDNVATPSAKTLWYQDGSLLHLLETVYVGADDNLRDFRFPVQWVNRPNADFRGYSGTIASGTLRTGDEVLILPSQKSSCIGRIVTRDGDLSEASSPQSVTVTLEDELDLARGDMIVRPGNLPAVSRTAEAMIVWMSDQPLMPGRTYWFKHTTRKTAGEIREVRYAVDVNTLHRSSAASLQLNEVGRCQLAFHEPMMLDSYRRNRETGSLIIVDRITHETVAAGMILDQQSTSESDAKTGQQPAGLRPRPITSHISATDRQHRYAQQPATLLITGLDGSGKTTLALELEQQLFEQGRVVVVLDGEQLRLGISRDLGFSADACSENLRRAIEVASILNDAGQICIAAMVAPEAETRAHARRRIGPARFFHIHLATPLDVCRDRDECGRYDAADQGQVDRFPGVTFEYQRPDDADLVISTAETTPKQAAVQILEELESRWGTSRND